MSVTKVETDIVANINCSESDRMSCDTSGNMYVETFKTDVTVFISNIIMCLTSH
jgi:hypothetical protein